MVETVRPPRVDEGSDRRSVESADHRRIEIIHESLLAAWPRLVRWQAQDHEGALLRDQLRQSARGWDERGRPDELLWVGNAYREFEVWRDRYQGGLTALEGTYTEAMTAHSNRRVRRRRLAIAAGFALLAIGLAVVGTYWRREAHARALAETETRRAEANQLLALGRLEIEGDPTGALAYAIASLERADDSVTRLFALEALRTGPVALIPEGMPDKVAYPWSVDLSPDGRWLAVGYGDGVLKLWSHSGGEPRLLQQGSDRAVFVRFTADSHYLVVRSYPSHQIRVWSIPEGVLARTLPTEGPVDIRLAGDPEQLFTFSRDGSRTKVEAWPLPDGESEIRGTIDSDLFRWSSSRFPWRLSIAPAGDRVLYVPFTSYSDVGLEERSEWEVLLGELDRGNTRILGHHETQQIRSVFAPSETQRSHQGFKPSWDPIDPVDALVIPESPRVVAAQLAYGFLGDSLL